MPTFSSSQCAASHAAFRESKILRVVPPHVLRLVGSLVVLLGEVGEFLATRPRSVDRDDEGAGSRKVLSARGATVKAGTRPPRGLAYERSDRFDSCESLLVGE